MKTHLKFIAFAIAGFFSLQTQNLFAQNNYFAGSGAGANNAATGTLNTFVGSIAGNKNTTGKRNSFVGSHAGYGNTTGSENSFFGAIAGLYNTTANGNSFFGFAAGQLNSTGANNSFFGRNAGGKNTTAHSNSFFGSGAGYETSTGAYNSFFGADAGGRNTTGSYNAFFGMFAGFNNSSGEGNTFIGTLSGLKNTTGKRNTFMGEGTGGAINTGSDNVFIGYRSENKWTGSSNGNTALGSYATAMGNNSTAIGFRAHVSASNSLVLGSVNGVNGATANTNVGIGTTAPAYRLHVVGDAAKPGSSAWTVASDKRLKEDINTFTDGLEILKQIKPVRYKYNGKAGMPKGSEYIGVIAQEVEQVAPYMIHKFTYQDSTGKEEYLDFDATALPYIIINAIKDQQQVIEQKDAQLQSVQAELSALKKEMEEIKKALGKKMNPVQSPVSARQSESDAILQLENGDMLLQNVPNPFNQSTSVQYHIPGEFSQAYITVHALSGEELQRISLAGKAQGEVEISAGSLSNGIYLYKLWVDGQAIATRKMILAR